MAHPDKIDVYLMPPARLPVDRSVQIAAQCECGLDALGEVEGVLARLKTALENERPEEARGLLTNLILNVNYLSDILKD